MSDSFPSDPGHLDPMGTPVATLDRREMLQEAEPGDHERFSHYVKKEKIMESAITGAAVKALCGKMWIPSRDPERFPVCPTCKEIYEGLRPGGDDDDQSDN